MQILGLALLLLGMALRLWTRRAIKGMYSGHVEVVNDHTLVTTGPYRYIRHPGYAGFVLLCLGIAAGYSSLIGLGAIPLLLIPGLAYRMRVEDDLLESHFGEDFRTYAQRVKKLIPGIW
jgi:protein-S-isoprenylcysteine O-methyltransferase Ste14